MTRPTIPTISARYLMQHHQSARSVFEGLSRPKRLPMAIDYIVIYPDYRVNAFGFLPGKVIKQPPTSDLNPGLLDQEFVLKLVQKPIHHFGGDPRGVTIWGQSAGGGSVVAQVLVNGRRRQQKLFYKALASSPFWPKTYRYDSPEAEAICNHLINLTGYADATDSQSCLKTVDV